MSVRLIVVALLAAAVTSAAAASEGSNETGVNVTACNSSSPKPKVYNASCPQTAGKSGLYWKADNCTVGQETDLVVKGYNTSTCQAGSKTASKDMCEPLMYNGASCSNYGGVLILIANCSYDAEKADNQKCVGCATNVIFTSASPCHKWGETYLKYDGPECEKVSEEQQYYIFKDYGSDEKCENSVPSPKTVHIPKACLPSYYYGKPTCDATGSKVTLKSCPAKKSDGEEKEANCAEDCESIDVKFNDYTKVGHQYFSIKTCSQDASESFTFETYADVKKYSPTCSGDTTVQGTCIDWEKVRQEEEAERKAAEEEAKRKAAEEEANKKNITAGNESNTDGNKNSTEGNKNGTADTNTSNIEEITTNNSTEDTGVIAPAHTVGVLALALCLLACLH